MTAGAHLRDDLRGRQPVLYRFFGEEGRVTKVYQEIAMREGMQNRELVIFV